MAEHNTANYVYHAGVAIPMKDINGHTFLATEVPDVEQAIAHGGLSKKKDIKDSGARTEFDTGAVRDAQGGKGRFDLLPQMTIWALAKHYEKGCQKYGDRNWEKGIPIKNYIDSAQRHLTKFVLGLTDENHLMSAMWNIACAYETLLRINLDILPDDLDNLPYPLKDVDIDGEVIDTWIMHNNFHNKEDI